MIHDGYLKRKLGSLFFHQYKTCFLPLIYNLLFSLLPCFHKTRLWSAKVENTDIDGEQVEFHQMLLILIILQTFQTILIDRKSVV